MSNVDKETLEGFRKSLFYGSRTDLLFKFLGDGGMSDGDAADFLQGLLQRLGDAFDTGDYDEVLSPNPPKDTDGRREGSGRGWVRELQGRWPGLLG